RMPRPLDGDELRHGEPALSDAVVAGFLVEEERHVRPETLCAGLLRRLTELGVEVRSGVEVVGGTREGRALKALQTSEGSIEGGRFVIATGAWSGLLTAAFGVPMPIEAGK